MIALRYISWAYAILLVFIFWCEIFPNISKVQIGAMSWQILYILFLITLVQRQYLRSAVIVIVATLVVFASNFYLFISFVYKLIQCRWYTLCNDDASAFLYVTVLLGLLSLLNLLVIFICFIFVKCNYYQEYNTTKIFITSYEKPQHYNKQINEQIPQGFVAKSNKTTNFPY